MRQMLCKHIPPPAGSSRGYEPVKEVNLPTDGPPPLPGSHTAQAAGSRNPARFRINHRTIVSVPQKTPQAHTIASRCIADMNHRAFNKGELPVAEKFRLQLMNVQQLIVILLHKILRIGVHLLIRRLRRKFHRAK